MDFIQNSSFAAEEVAALKSTHDKYIQQKEKMLASVVKATVGKANTSSEGIVSARKWVTFVRENPKWITGRVPESDFTFKLDVAEFLGHIGVMESKDQAYTKALLDVAASDARFYWTTTEDFYIDAAASDAIIKEKYKELPSISSKRKTPAQEEKEFLKLEAKRNKKNGIAPSKADDTTNTKEEKA